ncbi:GTP-binding protein [Salinibacterium sp. SWN139]|uniref:GTP-binding protein n=1 Tax=Salinibacterium sp. SWN139 TaxID=2792055 RepID=UPI0018CCF726|nr:GTP-binding protein [Salinibacterium sp. SWN139]MBH0054416.1 GTP-binding protein [Salinibacterium sp. SWN139]
MNDFGALNVDAVEHFSTVDTWRDPPQRYAAATLVVIGKTDLLPPADRAQTVERIRERVRARNAEAPIVIAEKGGIDPELVFDNASSEEAPDELPIAALLRYEHHEHHEHAASASVALVGPISPSALMDLLEEPPAGTYRLKGRVRVRGLKAERGYVVNVVGRMIHVAPLSTPPSVGELVAIGMDLDADAAHTALQHVAASQAGTDAAGLRRVRRYRKLSD